MGYPFEPANPQGYETCLQYFLNKHYKVGSDFVSEIIWPGQHTTLSDKSMRKRFAHLKYREGNEDKPFIGAFLTDARLDEIFYHRFVVCPGRLPCPHEAFNLWTPFAIERQPSLPRRDAFEPAGAFAGARLGWVFQRGAQGLGYYCDRAMLAERVRNLAIILERVGTLTDHDPKACIYLLEWQAHMFQYPEIKPEAMIVIVSKEGAGKG